MAATLPDVVITSTAYTNLYSATGIAVGTAVILQNKGNQPVFLQTTAASPSASSGDGFVISPLEILTVDAAEVGLWARSAAFGGHLSVQVN